MKSHAGVRLSFLDNCTNMTTRSFLVLGLPLILGLAIIGFQIGRAVNTGREFDRYLSVNCGGRKACGKPWPTG